MILLTKWTDFIRKQWWLAAFTQPIDFWSIEKNGYYDEEDQLSPLLSAGCNWRSVIAVFLDAHNSELAAEVCQLGHEITFQTQWHNVAGSVNRTNPSNLAPHSQVAPITPRSCRNIQVKMPCNHQGHSHPSLDYLAFRHPAYQKRLRLVVHKGELKYMIFSLWARDRDNRTGMLYIDVKRSVEPLGIFTWI
jgi:hypothetical protein